MNNADLHAMARARTALTDAKNELIRSGAGSDLTLRQLRDAETGLARQMDQHKETVEAVAQFIPTRPTEETIKALESFDKFIPHPT